ncbi:MAG: glutamate-cysteine ligase family protein [Gemmatimonadaceae bacterium]
MSLNEARLLDNIRQRFFSPQDSRAPRTIGVELELIPVHASTRLPALPRTEGARSTATILSRVGTREGWLDQSTDDDTPSWTLDDGARVSFEPGGQIEISSTPHQTASGAIRAVQSVVGVIRQAMAPAGIELLAIGVDPRNDIDAVPLQLQRDRYSRMTRYFDSIGPSGVRMMRQTAAVQINVERGSAPTIRWMLLNSLAPYIVALFANSRSYAGKKTKHASYRAHLWRTLDPSRTGLPLDSPDPAAQYLAFALDAGAMRSSDGTGPWVSFRDWMRADSPDEEEWQFHLSTLFPEVRPKEFFEIRSADAIDSELLAAPVVFVTGIVYDEESASRAAELLGSPSETLLERAGRLGLSDPDIHRIASELTALALSGAASLGEDYISPANLDIARVYFARVLTQ